MYRPRIQVVQNPINTHWKGVWTIYTYICVHVGGAWWLNMESWDTLLSILTTLSSKRDPSFVGTQGQTLTLEDDVFNDILAWLEDFLVHLEGLYYTSNDYLRIHFRTWDFTCVLVHLQGHFVPLRIPWWSHMDLVGWDLYIWWWCGYETMTIDEDIWYFYTSFKGLWRPWMTSTNPKFGNWTHLAADEDRTPLS